MRMVVKSYYPLRYLKGLAINYSRAWDYDFQGRSRLNYWLSILFSLTGHANRKSNYVCLALENGSCIGHLSARLANRPRHLHPVFFLLNKAVGFLLLLSGQGRQILKDHVLYYDHLDKSVQLGKYAIAGSGHKKVSLGISVAVDPKFRNSGIYRNMVRLLLNNLDGYFIFHTSTESVWQAHEKIGFKRIYEVPFPKPLEGTSFVMYGDKNDLFAKV